MEIRLRAWNTTLGRMSGIMTLKEIHSLHSIQFPILKWLRPTGMFDRNGVEIFEGDIVAGYSYNLHNGTRTEATHGHEVKFKNGCFEWAGQPMGWDLETESVPETCDTSKWALVIGNVFANPDKIKITK